MLSKEVKEAILNGAYGMIRDGRKVKYLGETDNKCYPLSFITVPDKISHIKPYGGIDIIFSTEDTWKGTLEDRDHHCDIVGLWVEPTPTVTFELPKPFKPKKQEIFFTLISTAPYRPLEIRQTYNAGSDVDKDLIEAGLCFKTEQDAQTWVNAFKKAFNEETETIQR
jgi:hypothetical protein|nr:MAG TPA: hypothetical protein [Caudoviricetes sp.]